MQDNYSEIFRLVYLLYAECKKIDDNLSVDELCERIKTNCKRSDALCKKINSECKKIRMDCGISDD